MRRRPGMTNRIPWMMMRSRYRMTSRVARMKMKMRRKYRMTNRMARMRMKMRRKVQND